MRKRLITTLALGALVAMVVGAVSASAVRPNKKPVVIRAGNLVLIADGGVRPERLHRRRFSPIAVFVSGSIRTTDGKHPPAFRRTVIDFDKNGIVLPRGLPVCRAGQLQARDTKTAKQVCRNAIVGAGKTKVQVEFPEQAPFTAEGPLVLFNGGQRGRTITLYIHGYVAVPAPTAIVTTVKLTRINKGRFGIRSVSLVPQIAGGSGSVLSFRLAVKRLFNFRGRKRSYLMARCPDGRFFAKIHSAIFQDETGRSGGNKNLSGMIVRPCQPRG